MKTYHVVVWANGTQYWCDPETKELHREDGPAYIAANGYEAWYKMGKLHRLDGPAQILPGVYKVWRKDGNYHREDGPAIEYEYGGKHWYLDGEKLTEAEWKERVNPKQKLHQELTVAEVEKLLGFSIKIVK